MQTRMQRVSRSGIGKNSLWDSAPSPKRAVAWDWLVDELRAHDECMERRLFGTDAFYLGGRIVACFTQEGDEPWNGILWPVERDSHVALTAEFSALVAHPVLGKWLYLSSENDAFESVARALLERILRRDPLLGVIPKPKKKRKPSPSL